MILYHWQRKPSDLQFTDSCISQQHLLEMPSIVTGLSLESLIAAVLLLRKNHISFILLFNLNTDFC